MNSIRTICYYTAAIFLGSLASSFLYYKYNNKKDDDYTEDDKSDFYHLIHGNIRFVKKLQQFNYPPKSYNKPQKILVLSLQSLSINPTILFDLDILSENIQLYEDDRINNNISVVKNIEKIIEKNNVKTIVILGLEENDDKKIKEQLSILLNTSQYINKYVEDKIIKPYWATYNKLTGYVKFHHHNYY